MRVLVVTLFTAQSGSSRVMAFQFLPLLRAAGLETDVLTIYPDAFFRVHMGLVPSGRLGKALNFGWYLVRGLLVRLRAALIAGRYDVVFVQRDPFPGFLLRLLRHNNPRIVYEFEDTFAATNPFVHGRSFLHRALLRYQLGLFRGMVAAARHVIASNANVAAEASSVNPEVTVLCEPIDLEPYRDLPEKNANGRLVIGWIGSPSTTSFLRSVERPLGALCRKYPELVVRVVGAADIALEGVRLERVAWRKESEVADLRAFDVGIMPLSDDPFYRAHLGHKMIQYMAVGIPVVASRTEVNASVVAEGENGFLVGSDEEWVERLSLLLDDAALRARLGQNGRALVEERFDLEKQAALLASVLRDVAERRERAR